MMKVNAIAKPYAQAAFETARGDKQSLSLWLEQLSMAAQVVEDARVKRLIINPRVDHAKLLAFIFSTLPSSLSDSFKRLIKLLTAYHRLSYLPQIASVFAELLARYNKTLTVKVSTAMPLNEAQQQRLVDALSKRFKCQVMLDCVIDSSLLAGVVIDTGDTIIDGSARGKLTSLGDYLREHINE